MVNVVEILEAVDVKDCNRLVVEVVGVDTDLRDRTEDDCFVDNAFGEFVVDVVATEVDELKVVCEDEY